MLGGVGASSASAHSGVSGRTARPAANPSRTDSGTVTPSPSTPRLVHRRASSSMEASPASVLPDPRGPAIPRARPLPFDVTSLGRIRHRRRNMRAIGLLLVVLGILAMVYGGFWYTKEEKAAEIGPIEVRVEKKERVNVPL